ncbi:MAG: hypothetical protein Q8916_00600 [Bacteroidota bacterium]|nr:hypothetical protein [Bacteroidota bacterium]MDP4228885.1 hypothetical protein [Bacteroidota bacterium]MDP4234950.1 hypothetical protein [Bacteroidota bacterium]
MSYIPFDQLPDSSRLWIFAANRALSDAEADMLTREMQTFCNSWLAHNTPVTGSAMMKYNQFLFVAADAASFPSGCSTDEMMRRVRILGETYGVEFFGMPRVQYRENGTIRSINRSDFEESAKGGKVTSETKVFDNTLTTLKEFREGKWELSAKNTWHARAFDFVS